MNTVKVPELLKGPWEHVLFVTYGADIPFYENALRPQLSPSCRNQIILADGERFLEACSNYAKNGLARYLNQQYVASGIFVPQSAHAKLILLTNSTRGRLLVGSGNLGWQGYASGGELFTHYEFSEDDPGSLAAFTAVREFLEHQLSLDLLSAMATRRVNHLFENTPWLFQTPAIDDRPVRHNMEQSFIEQLQIEIGEEPVHELWVMSPFFDRNACALSELLSTFQPSKTVLLFQDRHTSVDPQELERTISDLGREVEVRLFEPDGDDHFYVHAKLYLFRLGGRAVCLHGSPNLSQVAMLRAGRDANIELGNLLTGDRKAFDYLFKPLSIQPPVTSISDLELSYQEPNTEPDTESPPWRLTAGEWDGTDLIQLTYEGILPDLKDAVLNIGTMGFPLKTRANFGHTLEVRLTNEARELLTRTLPLSITWQESARSITTNPVYTFNHSALNSALEGQAEGKTLDHVGSLDLEDTDLEKLIYDLEATLVIDRKSIWQMTKTRLPKEYSDDGNDDVLHLKYTDIDFDVLRKHPRLQQYLIPKEGRSSTSRSRLQIILGSISEHLQNMLGSTPHPVVEYKTLGLVTPSVEMAETIEEFEEEAEAEQERTQSSKKRLQRIMMGFIRRYLRGLSSPEFQNLAGYAVTTQNYAIFSHILWLLFKKDWMDDQQDFLFETLLQMWKYFWGYSKKTGYVADLTEEELTEAFKICRAQRLAAVQLATLYYGAVLYSSKRYATDNQRVQLRDYWRYLLESRPFSLSDQEFAEAVRLIKAVLPYNTPTNEAILTELRSLAAFETRNTLLRGIETKFGFQRGSCSFSIQPVWLNASDREITTTCMAISSPHALHSCKQAMQLIQEWMRFEKLPVYRITHPSATESKRVAIYELDMKSGDFLARDIDPAPTKLPELHPVIPKWEEELDRLSTSWQTAQPVD